MTKKAKSDGRLEAFSEEKTNLQTNIYFILIISLSSRLSDYEPMARRRGNDSIWLIVESWIN